MQKYPPRRQGGLKGGGAQADIRPIICEQAPTEPSCPSCISDRYLMRTRAISETTRLWIIETLFLQQASRGHGFCYASDVIPATRLQLTRTFKLTMGIIRAIAC